MLISSVNEQISFPFENGIEVMKYSDATNGICIIQDFTSICTHTDVVPEHTPSDLSSLMSNLEGKLSLKIKIKITVVNLLLIFF